MHVDNLSVAFFDEQVRTVEEEKKLNKEGLFYGTESSCFHS